MVNDFIGQGRVERWRMDCQGLAMKSLFMQSLLFLAVAIFLSSCGGTSIRTTENATSARVMNLVNQERAKMGLGRVVLEGGLRQMAAGHAGFLERNVSPLSGRPSKSMAHYGFQERAKMARERNYLVLSEVVMIGYAGDLSAVAERTIQGWLSSPSHRKAILNPDRRIMGIETRLPADGRYFVVGLLSNGKFKQAQAVVEIKR